MDGWTRLNRNANELKRKWNHNAIEFNELSCVVNYTELVNYVYRLGKG